MNLRSSIKFDGQYGWRPTMVQAVELKRPRWIGYLVFLWETEGTRPETRWKEIPACIRTTNPRGDVQKAGDFTCGLSCTAVVYCKCRIIDQPHILFRGSQQHTFHYGEHSPTLCLPGLNIFSVDLSGRSA